MAKNPEKEYGKFVYLLNLKYSMPVIKSSPMLGEEGRIARMWYSIVPQTLYLKNYSLEFWILRNSCR